FSSDISTASLDLGTKIMLPDSESKGKDSVDLIRDSLFAIQVEKPWLLLQFGNSDTEEIGADRVEALVSASPSDEDGETRENVVKTEIEDNDNDNLTIPQVVNRLGMVFFLLIFNLGITIFIFLLTGMMLFSQILFIIYAMFLPISFLLSMIPTYENMAKQAVVRVFNAIMTRAGITLIVTVAFSISSMFYNISTDYPFFMVAFLQIICFAGIYMKLGELMSMFSLNANDSQQIGRRIFRRPMVFMRHRARRMEHRIARAVGAGSVAGAVAGASVARAGKPATNQPPKKRENTSASMGSRVGSAVGAVMDTKNKVRDSASSLKENVKDLPTQAGYAVHSAKQKAKDNVSDFKRGVVEERENRQEQRTQKRNQHRENISQKKQELQKAQEARQTVHANGSATAGATRSHERPVATPVPKPAQTDTVTKPDMKRPATSPVIKNAEVKAGKETVRTNIRQEQQVKSVARANQPNVAESISNHKKSTVQKTQVNGKSARKTVTKQSEKGRKK
uniref:CD3337/EF1877 family mobilome membrane protein n=1 Tax=uncultured Holdemanella sp. TaxID=1763549 RepID=UPI0025CF471F